MVPSPPPTTQTTLTADTSQSWRKEVAFRVQAMRLNQKWVWALLLIERSFDTVCLKKSLVKPSAYRLHSRAYIISSFRAYLWVCSLCIFRIYFLLWIFPSHYFPARFSLSSFPARSSQWRLWLTRVPSTAKSVPPLPSFSLHTVPCPFPYFRSCPCPLSLFSIMSLPSFPIFDYVPALFPYFRLCSCSPFISDGIMLLIQIAAMTIMY
jgi:hypothetical protein